MTALLFHNAAQVVTCAGPARARRGAEMGDGQVRRRVAVLVVGDRIASVGPPDELARAHPEAERVDCGGGVLTPGLVDSHTHAIFGRPRYEEQELRASGIAYMEIARQGGGIHASVRDVRSRSADELVVLAESRLRRLASYGTTVVGLTRASVLRFALDAREQRVMVGAESLVETPPIERGAEVRHQMHHVRAVEALPADTAEDLEWAARVVALNATTAGLESPSSNTVLFSLIPK